MQLINQITSDPSQSQNIVLPDGSYFTFQIQFVPMQLGWFITELSYGDFTLNGMRICVSPDFIYQFRNVLPFGIACLSNTRREPTQQEDFSSGAFNLYLLTQAEVAQYAVYLGT